MTATDMEHDDAGVRSARGDGAAQLRLVLAWLVVGVVLGALVGGLVGAGRASTYQAVTAVSSLPDSAVASGVGGSADSTSSDDVSAFIQGELVALNGAQLRHQVEQSLSLRGLPDVSASQVGMTDVIDITATSSSRAQSLRVATSLANAYKNRRTAELRSDVGTALSLVQQQLVAVRKSLTGTGSTSSSTTALRSQEASLLAQETSLQLSAAAENRAVQVVQPADISTPGLSKTVTFTLIGGLLGAILSMLCFVAWRQSRPRIRTTGDLGAVTDRVISPAFPSARGHSGCRQTDAAARLLASRLPTSNGPGSVVCVGTGRGVGTSFVAEQLAMQLAESSKVLLLRASSAMFADEHSQPAGPQLQDLGSRKITPRSLTGLIGKQHTRDDGVDVLDCGPAARPSVKTLNAALKGGLLPAAGAAGWTVVVDAPALDSSSLGAELATHADSVVVVVGRGKSRATEVAAALDVLQARRVQVLGTLLNRPAAAWRRRLHKPSPSTHLGEGRVVSEDPAASVDHEMFEPPVDSFATVDPVAITDPLDSAGPTAVGTPSDDLAAADEEPSGSREPGQSTVPSGKSDPAGPAPADATAPTEPTVAAVVAPSLTEPTKEPSVNKRPTDHEDAEARTPALARQTRVKVATSTRVGTARQAAGAVRRRTSRARSTTGPKPTES